MQRWFRSTREVPLMKKARVGDEVHKTVVFLNAGATIEPGQEFPVGDTETYDYSETEKVEMIPINIQGYPKLYILGDMANPNSPHCRMERIEKLVVPPRLVLTVK